MTETGGERPLRADARRNREQILAAARDAFVELGPAAPLEEIARRAGTGIATLYRRFPDRAALIRSVVLDAFERTVAVIDEALTEEKDPFGALVHYMHGVLDVRIAAVIPSLLGEIPFDDEELEALSRAAVSPIEKLIAEAHEAGTLRADVTFGDVGMMIVRLSRPLPGSFPRELNDQLAHRHLDLLVHGLRGDSASKPDLHGPAITMADLREMRPELPE
ncbi:TetR family transcriptional regulator [Herbihabitans rhizosphaerae]|uniref:TetR family transcriptional regulator n=1 Tax=Herbihabitans rhizosphaerae TaxID=1872711 RepID=A0A4V2ES65_9PSEU|nr:TetR/AcrR family transcriptional regulator [Herbihabitans rhizosphaerae]RZS36493.1 TetR family transcriptional regulator [Herbihabitans rhizosphaerae]